MSQLFAMVIFSNATCVSTKWGQSVRVSYGTNDFSVSTQMWINYALKRIIGLFAVLTTRHSNDKVIT